MGLTQPTRTVAVGPSDVEYRLDVAAPGSEGRPPLVFLHEALGSLGRWRDFPDRVRRAVGHPTTLVYSRHGHGWSGPARPRQKSYMHDEALVVLPELLGRLGLADPVLIGHSDGASIALIHAGHGHPTSGLVLLTPHVFVEDCTVAGIEAAHQAYLTTDMAHRMARHHADAETMFRAWSDTWRSPGFRDWNIEDVLPGIDVPVLVVQGTDDQYGTLAQVDAVERGVAGSVERLVLDGVGHAPHVEAADVVVERIARFMQS